MFRWWWWGGCENWDEVGRSSLSHDSDASLHALRTLHIARGVRVLAGVGRIGRWAELVESRR